jgi:hypothetical protein
MSGIKGKSGGARKGAGRKPKEPTKTLAYRVPLKHAGALNEALKKTIEAYLKKHK